MKRFSFLLPLMLLAFVNAATAACAASQTEIIVPNLDADAPACRMRVSLKAAKCIDQVCLFPVSDGAVSEPVPLSFTCSPSSTPTGFEKPAPYAKILRVRTKHASGNISLIDDIETPAATRQQDLNFCLYGKKSNLCGFSRTWKIKGKESPTVREIIDLIKRIEWDESTS